MLFSFALFDRQHPLFNLVNSETQSVHLESEWYVSLLDILAKVSQSHISELKSSVKLHPFDFKNSNLKEFDINEQYEYWQFRITHKSRIIGVKIDNIFYVRWLDPHHNHCDCEGRPGIYYCCEIQNYQQRLEDRIYTSLKRHDTSQKRLIFEKLYDTIKISFSNSV